MNLSGGGILQSKFNLSDGTGIRTEAIGNFRIFPNLVNDHFTLDYDLDRTDELSVSMLDMQGKIIESHSGYYSSGKHTMEIDLRGKAFRCLFLPDDGRRFRGYAKLHNELMDRF